jgi:hypothetical protein
MAGREDQAQHVVGGRVLRLASGPHWLAFGLARLDSSQTLHDRLLLDEGPFPPQPVDRAVARNPGDPGARVVRQPVRRPALERDDERLLDRLLGEVEVAENADQRRDRPSRLTPEQAVDDSSLIGGPRDYEAASTLPSAGSKPNCS